jgi:hypothetical protein
MERMLSIRVQCIYRLFAFGAEVHSSKMTKGPEDPRAMIFRLQFLAT